jgi:site-specific recombinase XerD
MQKLENGSLSISELTAAVRLNMVKLRYSSPTLYVYDCIWKDLLDYANRNAIINYDVDVGNQFALDCYGYKIGTFCKKEDNYRKKTVTRAMQYLLDYQAYGVTFECSSRGKYQWHQRYKDLFDAFLAQMIKAGYADSTLITIKSCMQGFETFLKQKNIVSFADLTRDDVQRFISTFSKYAKSTLGNRMLYLRLLLIFAFEKGYNTEELATACPKILRVSTLNSIPSTFTKDEVQRLLKSVDRANPVGKRDYAIILTVARLGLRAVDVRGLKFENIDWYKQEIRIIQSKTKEPLTLPLLDDVGWAIIDYLKNGRPKSACEYIFIKHLGSFNELESNPYNILQKYLCRAMISCEFERRHGLHALRHSLASQLLEESVPLEVISGVLGHTNSKSTYVYLKIDIIQLRTCALEVPNEHYTSTYLLRSIDLAVDLAVDLFTF